MHGTLPGPGAEPETAQVLDEGGIVDLLGDPCARTLQPEWKSAATWSASKATRAPRTADWSLVPPLVRKTIASSTMRKLTGNTSG